MDDKNRDSVFRDWLQEQKETTRLQLGVSFQDLECYGFTSSVTFQHTVTSYALALPRLIARIFSRQQLRRVQILRNFYGLVEPGEMLLTLGRPGSGCSSFIKVLSGDTHGIHVGERVQVNYAGVSYNQLHQNFKGECIYLAELDKHFPELSVGQTLGFAASTREKGANSRTASQIMARQVAALFGLSNAFDSQMGNELIRGVSGGETRRTSIAEALISGAQLQCWDNSTRGLDSSTAQRFIDMLKSSTKALRSTVIMSIYQGSDAMYNNFDKVTVLYEGRQIYFGPVKSATDYFHRLGFEKDNRATTADFLTSLTNPAERIVREGFEDHTPRSPEEFATAWKRSAEREKLIKEIDAFDSAHPLQTSTQNLNNSAENSSSIKEMLDLFSVTYMIPMYRQILICLQRGFLRLRNNYVPAVSTIFANAILAIVVGSMFYDLPETSDSVDQRAVLIFFSLMICAFSPAFEAFYHPSTEAVAAILCDFPVKFGTTLMFHVTLYFMTNLRRTASAFFTYVAFMFFIVLTMSMVFRTLGSLSRTLEQTMAPASIVVLLCIVYTGFVIPVPYMKPWLSWFRWLNPMSYAYESLMINEFNGREFPCSSTIPAGPKYSTQVGMSGKVCSIVGAEPGEPNVQGSSYLLLKYGYQPSHLWMNFGIIIALMIVFCAIHLLAAEYIPAQRSKGEVLLFRRDYRNKQSQRELYSENTALSPTFAQENGIQSDSEAYGNPPSTTQTALQPSSVFHWNNLSYDVQTKKGSKRVLKDINGWIKPGTLTALIGVTGAGKTTLLDVLANRATFGTASGEVYIDGVPRDASFQRKIGYVQQEDTHLPTATVREALEFSALLRQSGTNTKEKLNQVENIIRILDMESYSEAVVGSAGSGLNIEQRQRLSIGVELVAKPELLLFLDEPTSGLDSQTAWSTCSLLRKLANHGQAVLPVEWVLKVISGSSPSLTMTTMVSDESPAVTGPREPVSNWAQKWNESQHHQEAQQYLEQANKARNLSASGKTPTRPATSEYAASFNWQLLIVTRRIFQEYCRDPTYLHSKLALCAGVCFFNGISFYRTSLDMQGFINFLFSIFLISQLFSTLDQQIIPRLADSRTLFEARERKSKSYPWTIFLTANIIVELFWQAICSIVIFITWYYPTGLWRNGDPSFGTVERGSLVFLLIWLFCLWISTFSQAVGVGIEHVETAVQIGTLFFWLSLVFCGVLVPPNILPRFWTFVYRASPLTYFVNGMVLAALADTHIDCSDIQLLHIDPPFPTTCDEYLGPFLQYAGGVLRNPVATTNCLYCPVNQTNQLLQRLGLETEHVWRNVAYMAIYITFNTIAVFVIYWFARVPKRNRR
ncbi:hypothetical protein DSL72_003189 [Monilinia vaccinii-corymbosi]|uniref:ABC transporter domain-containing protein n=1 Tax=Monilinia vaccinii-corymbosi TaxID=61207 RepID=A0A8A3P7M6_9HELO|nr:hypothetical protein DSL72_003189 [Monilinia vaccinii-corymbosi]